MAGSVGSGERLLLVFGDQTDSLSNTLELLYSQSSASPWLQLFLQRATSILRDELSAAPFKEACKGDFTDLIQFTEQIAAEDTGLSALLVTTVRAGVLIQYAASNPDVFSSQVPICLAAVCGGLLNALALQSAHDMSSLYQAGLDSIRLAVRLVQIVGVRTRAVYDGPGRWGWYVSGVDAARLQSILDSYHEAEGTAPDQTIRIAGTGLEESWHTVIGPPPVLKHFFGTNQLVKQLPNSELPIKGYVHVGPAVTQTEMDEVLSGMTSMVPILDSPVPRTNVQLISLGEGGLLSAPTWRSFLSLVAREILTQPLNLTRGLGAVKSAVEDDAPLRVLCVGPSLHIPTVCAYLEFECDKVLNIENEPKIPFDALEPVPLDILEAEPPAGQDSSGIAVTAESGQHGEPSIKADHISAQTTRTPSPATSTSPSSNALSDSTVATAPDTPADGAKVNVVLLQGRKASGKPPLFMFPDGTGSASTYMYLGRLRDNRPLYVVESPILDDPNDSTILTVEQASRLYKQAVIKTHPAGDFLLAGYSLGSVYAYETARQLIRDGYSVQGLMLFDMAVPRPRANPGVPSAMDLLLPPVMLKFRSLASAAGTMRSVAEYDPEPMPAGSRPGRVWLAWCERGVMERLDQDACGELNRSGLATEAGDGFMEDPAVGTLAWVIPSGKPLGYNGWDRLVGEAKCASIDADHFTMLVPPGVTKFQKAIEEGLVYCTER